MIQQMIKLPAVEMNTISPKMKLQINCCTSGMANSLSSCESLLSFELIRQEPFLKRSKQSRCSRLPFRLVPFVARNELPLTMFVSRL